MDGSELFQLVMVTQQHCSHKILVHIRKIFIIIFTLISLICIYQSTFILIKLEKLYHNEFISHDINYINCIIYYTYYL